MKYEFIQPIVPTYALTYLFYDENCWLYLDKVLFWRISDISILGVIASTTPELETVTLRDSLVSYFVEPDMNDLDFIVRKKFRELEAKFKVVEVYINGVRKFYDE